MTSPSCIKSIVIIPPSGVKLSCMELTEPLDAAVVKVAQVDEAAIPNRVSLPLHISARLIGHGNIDISVLRKLGAWQIAR